MRISTYAVKLFAAAVVLALPLQAVADPLFTLDDYGDWNGAPITPVGLVSPGDPYYDALEANYGDFGTEFLQVEPQLYVYKDGDDPAYPDLGDGLVMHWGNPTPSDPSIPQVATWEYTYPADPDLTGTRLILSVNTPNVPPIFPGVTSVSLTLNSVDVAGLPGWASWTWNVGLAGPIFPNVPFTVNLDPTLPAMQSGSSTFRQSVAVPGLTSAYDVTRVTTIMADELAVGPGVAGGWVNFPPVPAVGGAKPWNYWSGMQVVAIPEPVTMLAVGLGVASLGGYLRKRRMR